MNLLNNIKVLVFDFDGVIVDSEAGKRNAWRTLFSTIDDPEGFLWSSFDIDRIIKEALTKWIDGALRGSRYEVIEYAMDAVSYPKSRERIQLYADYYDKLVQDIVLTSGLQSTEMTALLKLSERFPLYINSGTPETNLQRSVKALGIDHLFKGVLGKTAERNENSKVQNLMMAAMKEQVEPREVLFIGDAESDYRAALSHGCVFVRFSGTSYGSEKTWEKEAPHTIHAIDELITS